MMLQKRSMNRKKCITNKPAGKCHARNVINIESGSRPESHFFQMEPMKIKTAGNHAELKKKRLYPTAARPDIRPVPLDRTKSTLGLNTSYGAARRECCSDYSEPLRETASAPRSDGRSGFPCTCSIFPYADGRCNPRTEKIIIIAAITCVRDRIFGILTIKALKSLHQRLKTVHI